MYQSQAILEANTSRRSRSLRECHGVSWKRLLPSSWAEFAVACDYRPLNSLAEAQNLFAEFDSIAI